MDGTPNAGQDDAFNCVNLKLTAYDIDDLEEAIRSRGVPPTSGFFVGESDGGEIDDDLQFVAKAREAIAAGLTVFYSSWWCRPPSSKRNPGRCRHRPGYLLAFMSVK